MPSPDFGWHWPLLAVRRAGAMTIMEQVVPHTFLRTRLLTHVFGGSPDDHKQSTATIKHVCERLQADRNEGRPAIASPLVIAFHSRSPTPTHRTARRPERAAVLSSGRRFFASHYVHSWIAALLLHGARRGPISDQHRLFWRSRP